MADSTGDVCLERFINVMADLITKYADKIDLDSLPNVQMPEAEIKEISVFFILRIHQAYYLKIKKKRRLIMSRLNYNLGSIPFQAVFTTDKLNTEEIDAHQTKVLKLQDEAQKKYIENGAGVVVTFKNGNAFVDGGINIKTLDGKINNYMAYPVYMNDNFAYDEVNGYNKTDVYEYLKMLDENNKKLRIDLTMSYGTPWDSKIEYWLNKYSKRR